MKERILEVYFWMLQRLPKWAVAILICSVVAGFLLAVIVIMTVLPLPVSKAIMIGAVIVAGITGAAVLMKDELPDDPRKKKDQDQ